MAPKAVAWTLESRLRYLRHGRVAGAEIRLGGVDVALHLGLLGHELLEPDDLGGGVGVLAGQRELVSGAQLGLELEHIGLVRVHLIQHLLLDEQIAYAGGGNADDGHGYNWVRVCSRVSMVLMYFDIA